MGLSRCVLDLCVQNADSSVCESEPLAVWMGSAQAGFSSLCPKDFPCVRNFPYVGGHKNVRRGKFITCAAMCDGVLITS